MTEQTKKLHTVEGRVVSNKMDKTVTVLVERLDVYKRQMVSRSTS